MTVLGKILVFVNMVFSLLTAGLIVMVYTTRINWKDAYTKQSAAVQVARADAVAVEEAKTDEIKRKEAEYQALLGVKTKLEADVKGVQEQLVKAAADYDALQKAQSGNSQNIVDLTKELERRKNEVENLHKLVASRDQKIADIDRQMAKLRDESVQYKVQWDQSKERVGLLQGQVEALARENGQLRSQLGGGSTPTAMTPTAPHVAAHAADVRGTVQRVEGDLATITPGSDAGVNVGSELQIYRLQPKPEYLGSLKILAVSPTEAVGRITGTKRAQVRKGDEVAANVLGGR